MKLAAAVPVTMRKRRSTVVTRGRVIFVWAGGVGLHDRRDVMASAPPPGPRWRPALGAARATVLLFGVGLLPDSR